MFRQRDGNKMLVVKTAVLPAGFAFDNVSAGGTRISFSRRRRYTHFAFRSSSKSNRDPGKFGKPLSRAEHQFGVSAVGAISTGAQKTTAPCGSGRRFEIRTVAVEL
jgi:hypothetical protein